MWMQRKGNVVGAALDGLACFQSALNAKITAGERCSDCQIWIDIRSREAVLDAPGLGAGIRYA